MRARPLDPDGADGRHRPRRAVGLLIKGPEVLEFDAQGLDTVVLDKTGTVTSGKMGLVEIAVADRVERSEALRLVGALENASEHPIAQAIARAVAEAFTNRERLGWRAWWTVTRSSSAARRCWKRPTRLGLSIGTGTDVAIEASDLTLVSGDLRAAADAIRLSRATLRTIKQNLAWAFGYNVAAVPLAAIGLLNPVIAGAAMAFSSVSVILNALRLRRFQAQRSAVATTMPAIRAARPATTAA